MEKVNVIIPNYNNEKYIEQCIESVINQNYPSLEIFIVDDGSTDASLSKIRTYENERVHVLKQCNMNASVARNYGLGRIESGYVLFIDSDDYLNNKNVISEMVEKMQESCADIVIGNYIDFNGKYKKQVTNYTSRIIERENIGDLLDDSPVPTNKLYKFDIIKENNLWFDNLRIGQDVNFYLKYMVHCYRACTMESVVYLHRVTSGNMSNSKNFNILDVVNAFLYVEKYYTHNGLCHIYEDSIADFAYKNLFWQMMKFIKFENKIDRKIVLNYFILNLKKYEKQYKINQRERLLLKIIKLCRPIIYSNIACCIMRKILAEYEKRKNFR